MPLQLAECSRLTPCEIGHNRKVTTRGLIILVARLTGREHKRIFSLCHYFAIMKPVQKNESRYLGQNEMAGLKGKSGPPGNMNAFLQARACGYSEAARGKHYHRARGKHQAA